MLFIKFSTKSYLESRMFPKHIERMGENKRREQSVGETKVSYQENRNVRRKYRTIKNSFK